MTDPAPLRDGRYVLLGRLGEGTQATTWDGVDKREGHAVAIKQFDVRGAKTWKDVELAEREARVLAALSHPKLPRYGEHFEENGVLYLVMEKIEGTPLSALRKRGPLPEEDVIRLLRDADDVLAYLHTRAPPVIHRDLKPSNVIRRPDGSFAFVDFGAVRDRMRVEGGSTVVGTFGYMAPEQFQGRAGAGSDVYAIAATALAMLTGVEPENLPHKGLTIDVDAALAGRGNRRLAAALTKMLEPNPDLRPTRIAPLLEGLRGGRSGEPEARPDSEDTRRERAARRRGECARSTSAKSGTTCAGCANRSRTRSTRSWAANRATRVARANARRSSRAATLAVRRDGKSAPCARGALRGRSWSS
jgi:serine/threonine protein kinase